MTSSNKNTHLTYAERTIIETGIRNGSSKVSIANTLGKDKSTIGKEIRLHRFCSMKCNMPLECINYKKCKLGRACKPTCTNYIAFTCSRRDRSPGACNGCTKAHSCHFNHYKYDPVQADCEYRQKLHSSREGINITEDRLVEIGRIIEPLIKQGQSPYAILKAHPELDVSEKTIYTYIENRSFKNAGIDIVSLDLRRQSSRKITEKKKNEYKIRKDRKYLVGRKYEDYALYIEQHPDTKVVQMDTVYNDVSNSPFIQTFKFMRYSFTILIYSDTKDSESMYEGILILEEILGEELFNQEVEVILTDRGSEFTAADKIETRADGTRRTRIFYCDPMRSNQKGSLENNHEEIRYICPKSADLRKLGFIDQKAANKITSHINSFPKERLNGKTPFELLRFMNPQLAQKLIDYGIEEIEKDKVVLKPYLLK